MKKEKRKLNKDDKELKSLSSELGSFGLEPPKLYRQEQRDRTSAPSSKKKKSTKSKGSKKAKDSKPLTRQEMQRRRQKKKKIRLALSIVLVIVAVAVVIVILSLTVFFKIDTITIKGNKKYTTQQVSAVLPIEMDKNLFLCDTKGASEKLTKNLPYIYDVKIERHLPSTIEVIITETPKVYAVKNADKTYTLLDDNFKVLEISVSKAPKNAITITNVKFTTSVVGEIATFSSSKKEADLKKMSAVIKSQNLKEITKIYSKDINNNFLVYDNRITIKIGSTNDIEDKLYSAYTALEKLKEANPEAEGELTSTGGKQVYFTEAR